MGIGYVDEVMVYNRYEDNEGEYYIGTRFEHVRVELTKGAYVRNKGAESADTCVVKIPNRELVKPYITPEKWQTLADEEKEQYFTLGEKKNDFFVITKKEELSIDINPPEGVINSSDYEGGFFEHIKGMYGYAYSLNNVDVYTLIPRFEIGGS